MRASARQFLSRQVSRREGVLSRRGTLWAARQAAKVAKWLGRWTRRVACRECFSPLGSPAGRKLSRRECKALPPGRPQGKPPLLGDLLPGMGLLPPALQPGALLSRRESRRESFENRRESALVLRPGGWE